MMKCIRLAILALTLLGALIAPVSVSAHPLGNFTVNRYSRIVIGDDHLVVYYVVDMAEIPTFQEMRTLDANNDGQVSNDEQQHYLARTVDQVRRGLSLEIDDAPVELRVTSADLTMPEGQGGLPTLRMEIGLTSPLPLAGHESRTLYYRDDNAAQRSGWREVIIFGDAATIISSTVSTTDVSDALRAYPDHLLGNPLDQREARATFVTNGIAAGSASMPGPRAAARSADSGTSLAPAWVEQFVGQLVGRPIGQASELTELVSAGRLGPSAMALALLIALIWGGAHALSPGHGKTVVAAYLIGSRGTAWHALYLGLTVTATHTLGIYALGLVTLFASQFLLPEDLYPWLALVSGLAVVGVGSTLLVGRARQLGAARDDEHDHHHEHGHDHHHSHEHEHSHDHGHTHSHLPPGADDRPVTWRNLLVLGIAGGLLPCPSALVLLLGAIALGQTAFGLVMVVSFSVGLAGVLTIIGIALVYARAIVTKVRFGRPSRLNSVGGLLRVAPIGSALIIALVGLAMTVQALAQTGLIRL